MNLTIYASDDSVYLADELMEEIKKETGWKIIGNHDGNGECFEIEDREGRRGSYDVEADILLWNDDADETEYNLFGNDHDAEWVGYSLAELIDSDGATGVWGDGDDGRRYFMVNT